MADSKYSNVKNLVNGDNLYLYVFDVPTAGTVTTGDVANMTQVLAFATSVELSVEGDTIDTSNKMSCRWNGAMLGKNSYTISSDALYTTASELSGQSFDYLMAKMVGDGYVGWAIGQITSADTNADCADRTYTLDTTQQFYCGVAAVTSISLSAGNSEIASCSITLTGNGAIVSK